MEENKKRRIIKMYFIAPNVAYPIGITGIGILLAFLGILEVGILVALGGVVLFVSLYGTGGASEKQIDTWFREDLRFLQKRAMERLGLEPVDVPSDPVVITGPILWDRPGVPKEELVWKKGKDKTARFAIHRVTIIFLTEHYMNSYCCDFNFLRRVALNEQDSQYHYKDVVAVSMGELSQSHTLSTGEKMVSAEGFRLSFSSGDKISVVVSAQSLKDITKAELPTSGIEKAVKTIRAMLQSKL